MSIKAEPGKKGDIVNIVERNIQTLLKRSREEEKKKTFEDRIANMVTRFTGSLLFVYIHLTLFSIWIIWNLGWIGIKPFDPSFVTLAMIASVEGIFLSTFVLISQNSMNAQADKRADLNLHVGLLSEHEVTRLITLVTAMAKTMNIPEALHPEIAELSKDVHPEHVLDTIEKHSKEVEKERID